MSTKIDYFGVRVGGILPARTFFRVNVCPYGLHASDRACMIRQALQTAHEKIFRILLRKSARSPLGDGTSDVSVVARQTGRNRHISRVERDTDATGARSSRRTLPHRGVLCTVPRSTLADGNWSRKENRCIVAVG